MSATVRSLNNNGVEEFRKYLSKLKENPGAEPPFGLLVDDDHTEKLSRDAQVENIKFKSRFEAAKYLSSALSALGKKEIDQNEGLWSWLSLFYFDQVCPKRLKPGRDCRHIPEFNSRNRNRHLLEGPYNIYYQHGELSRILLYNPVHQENEFFRQITSRQSFVSNRGVIEAAHILYCNEKTGLPKKGAQGKRESPGALLRFIDLLRQLDVTYDIYGMSGQEIIELLPDEFNIWK